MALFGAMGAGRRDARRNRRQAVNSRATIRPDGGFARWPCVVLDTSDTGVRLKLEGHHAVPATFNFVPASGGLGRRVRVKWRRGQEVGVEYF
jgi:hypothetical protein